MEMENLSLSRKPTIPEAGSKVLGSPGVVKLKKMAVRQHPCDIPKPKTLADSDHQESSKEKKPAAERMYQMCLELLAEADQALERQKAIRDEERSKYSQNLSQEQYWESVVQMTLPIDQRKAQEKKSFDGKSVLEKQLPQMKQALDAARTTNQHQVACDDVFAVLQRAQRSLITKANEIGKMLELLQVKRNASFTL
jgi:hypothetical protein